MYQAISSDIWIKVTNKSFYLFALEKECIEEKPPGHIITNIKSSHLKECE